MLMVIQLDRDICAGGGGLTACVLIIFQHTTLT